MHSLKSRRTLTLSIWFGYVFFVIYGSLVPLDFKPIPFDQAWTIFQDIPMYKLGVESRADWIANGVLYVPVGFLTAHLLIQKFSAAWRFSLLFLGAIFSFALAFGVEFSQLFFPPRTVSLNDLFAECVGSLIGLILAVRYSAWFTTLLHVVFGNPGWLALRLVEAYLAAYVAFSLFPFDILLSSGELEQKILDGSWGLLLADDAQGKALVALKLIAEIILTLPFGLFLGYRASGPRASIKQAAWWGLGLGCFIEIAQFFTASGVSQGLSVVTRILGVCGGMVLWSHRTSWSPERVGVLVNRYAIPVAVIYFLALLQVNGWFTHEWNGADFSASQFKELHFLPFYYHYFTTEAKALFSLASVCLMYLPIGLLMPWSPPVLLRRASCICKICTLTRPIFCSARLQARPSYIWLVSFLKQPRLLNCWNLRPNCALRRPGNKVRGPVSRLTIACLIRSCLSCWRSLHTGRQPFQRSRHFSA